MSQNPHTWRVENEQYHTLLFDRDEQGFKLNNQRFTKIGFERFCDLLGLPVAYLMGLPAENAKRDLLASMMKAQVPFINFLLKRKTDIVGCSLQQHVVFAADVLARVFAPRADHENQIRQIVELEDQYFVYFVREQEIPFPGDIHELGLAMELDDTTGAYPRLSNYAYRLVCSNGLVVRRLVKLARFSSRTPPEKMLTALERKLEDQFGMINTKYILAVQDMSQRRLNPQQHELLRRFLFRALAWELHTGAEETYQKQVPVTATFYDLLNYMSDFAKSVDATQNYETMALAGELIEYFSGAVPECFRGYADFSRRELLRDPALLALVSAE